MNIIIFLLFILTGAWADSKTELWRKFEQSGRKLLDAQTIDPQVLGVEKEFYREASSLEELAYKETETEALTTRVENHLKEIRSRIWHPTRELGLDYLSFQHEASLKNPTTTARLIVTNSVFCLGGGIGRANDHYRYGVDGCAFYGEANVGSQKNSVTYKQSDIATYGVRVAPVAGAFVSSVRAELGLRLPVFYTHQSLTRPANATLRTGSDFTVATAFYLRYPIMNGFFSMEFGKFLSQDTTIWGLGFGWRF